MPMNALVSMGLGEGRVTLENRGKRLALDRA